MLVFNEEFRLNKEWDVAISRSAVMVHRFAGNQSYIMSGTRGNLDLVAGDRCLPWIDGKTFVTVSVIKIDEINKTATINISYSHAAQPLP